ncbi:NADH dehydrogenase-like complex O [Rhynchospora pubera]|uniref:NADH dehydrogenase-like complex O n=1 Tax=Rhynchospora pubera TaxID=906938 RepID=A0AAV8GZZ8_9POAL|nr:NADH dehydrogenase-like complex O [Rhynchospora pubera]KAJ4757532.1 NADH dehydrogenase-like complex O [Rhynchospora pubera]KAJ4810024.1 NADH dehydrogenase-like complex O [Rhynchospora pubera]
MASSPIKISHRFPQSFLFSSSNSTNRTTTNAAPNIYPGAVRLKPVCSAAASASGPAEPAKVKPATTRPKKPVYSMKKGQIVRVDKEKYLNSINYLSVDHPPYYKGLDYIYEDRGEVLDIRNFETGECALIAWVGIPTPPAWLPTDMLIKSEKLDYERI